MIDIPGCNEDRPDEPSTECTRRHRWVVVIVNNGTDLGVWGVLVGGGEDGNQARGTETHTMTRRAASTLSSS